MKTRCHVVFVCMGNICRSPTAHGVFRHKLQLAGLATAVTVDSAATHAYHTGAAPDPRSQSHARARGYELADLRARPLAAADFEQADLLLVMDDDNLDAAADRCPPALRHKLRRLTEFCRSHRSTSVPDPYCGGPADFERVLDLVEDACDGLLEHVRRERLPPRRDTSR
jgi:protein-tyrosine phosphatase